MRSLARSACVQLFLNVVVGDGGVRRPRHRRHRRPPLRLAVAKLSTLRFSGRFIQLFANYRATAFSLELSARGIARHWARNDRLCAARQRTWQKEYEYERLGAHKMKTKTKTRRKNGEIK